MEPGADFVNYFLVALVVNGLVFAWICAWLAGEKHRNPFDWGVAGFLFGFLALIVLGFAPVVDDSARRKREEEDTRHSKRGSTNLDEQMKKCPACAEMVKLEALKCRYCGHEFDPEEVAQEVCQWQEWKETVARLTAARQEEEGERQYALHLGNPVFEIEHGNTEKAIRILRHYPYERYGALVCAIRFRNLDVINVLLEYKYIQLILNTSHEYGGTPLHKAVRADDIGIVRALVEHGAKANIPSLSGQTPLNLAEQLGNPAIIRFLQNQGAKSIAPLYIRLNSALTRLFERRPEPPPILPGAQQGLNIERKPFGLVAETSPILSDPPNVLHYACPTCKTVLTIPRQYAGQKGKCQSCGTSFIVPEL